MKRQIILALTIMAFAFTSNSATAQVAPKKKAVTTAVKKGTATAKKAVGTAPKKATVSTDASKPSIPTLVSNEFGGYRCKVIKTAGGCNLVFESNLDPKSEGAKKGTPNVKKEFKVSYVDNSIMEVGKADALVLAAKVKNEAPVMNEEELASKSNFEETKVAIKNLTFLFDVEKTKKEMPSSNNACTLPAKIADGIYLMNVNWFWDMPSDKVKRSYCSQTFKIEVKDGYYISVN